MYTMNCVTDCVLIPGVLTSTRICSLSVSPSLRKGDFSLISTGMYNQKTSVWSWEVWTLFHLDTHRTG